MRRSLSSRNLTVGRSLAGFCACPRVSAHSFRMRLISAPESYKARSCIGTPLERYTLTSTAIRSCLPLVVGSSLRWAMFLTGACLFPHCQPTAGSAGCLCSSSVASGCAGSLSSSYYLRPDCSAMGGCRAVQRCCQRQEAHCARGIDVSIAWRNSSCPASCLGTSCWLAKHVACRGSAHRRRPLGALPGQRRSQSWLLSLHCGERA